jgi:amidase
MEIRPQPMRNPLGVPWQELASLKRQKIQDKIHKTWLLDQDIISKAKHQKTLAGDFLDNLLDSETVRITMQDPYDLLEDLIKGKETTVKGAKAFCKRAVTTHQIVSPTCLS